MINPFNSSFLSDLLTSLIANEITHTLHGGYSSKKFTLRNTVKFISHLSRLIMFVAKNTIKELDDRFHTR